MTHEEDRLDEYGLKVGMQIRFRKHARKHWQPAKVLAREPDGSIRLVDEEGRIRSILPMYIERRARGPRGGRTWRVLTRKDS